MGKKNLVSINDFSRDEILKIMDLAARFEADPHQQVLAGKVIATLFFEPSTRTRLSFESAINHLGGVSSASLILPTPAFRKVRPSTTQSW